MIQDLFNASDGNTYVMRWAMRDKGDFTCPQEAVNVARLLSTELAKVLAKNASLRGAEESVLTYEAELRAGQADAAATDPVKALARVRAGLGPDADEDAQAAYAADQATIMAEWGGAVEITILADPVPESVSSRQFKLQLHIAGLTETVEGWINGQDPTIRIAYENSGSFVRSEPMMASGFAALGFSEAQIDAFFVAAGKL